MRDERPKFKIVSPPEVSDQAIGAIASLILDMFENDRLTPDPQVPASGSVHSTTGNLKGGHKHGTHDGSQRSDSKPQSHG